MATGEGFALIKSSDIEFGKFLGGGGFGGVSLATHKNWGAVAVKEFKDVTLTDDIRKEAKKMWRVISCPYLVRIMGFIDDPKNLGIVMEYCEYGSLKDFNRKYMMECDCWARKIKMIQDVSLGMNYLHTQNPPVIHRDLKLDNIFVGDGLNAKIGDLGLAVSGTSIQTKSAADIAGTCTHIPPEAWAGTIQKPDKFWDIFTYGITIYEFASGKHPWPSFANAGLISVWVREGHRPDLKAIPSDTPEDVIVIMERCWNGDPSKRPSFQEIQKLITDIFQSKYKAAIRKADRVLMGRIDSVSDSAAEEEGASASLKWDPDEDPGTVVEGSMKQLNISDTSEDSGIDMKKTYTSKDGEGVKSKDSGIGTGHGERNLPIIIGTWKFEKEVDVKQEPGKIERPSVIACAPNGDIAVSECFKGRSKIYDRDGKHKFSLTTSLLSSQSLDHCIAIDSKGNYFVTDRSAYVKAYDIRGRYTAMWLAVSPGDKDGNGEKEAKLLGIAMDANGNLLVGAEERYISKHKCDGSHKNSFSVSIRPAYLAVTSQDTVVISDHQKHVQLVTQSGDLLHTVQYFNMECPAGVCYYNNVIFVCDGRSDNISCLSLSGERIGCVTLRKRNCQGCRCVAMNKDGTKLYVTRCSEEVEMYSRYE